MDEKNLPETIESSKTGKKSKKFFSQVIKSSAERFSSQITTIEECKKKQSVKSLSRKSEFELRKLKLFPKVEPTKSRLLLLKKAEIECKSYGVVLPTVSPIDIKLFKSLKSPENRKMKSFKKEKSKSLSKSYSDSRKHNEVIKLIKDNSTEKIKISTKVLQEITTETENRQSIFDSKVVHIKSTIDVENARRTLPQRRNSTIFRPDIIKSTVFKPDLSKKPETKNLETKKVQRIKSSSKKAATLPSQVLEPKKTPEKKIEPVKPDNPKQDLLKKSQIEELFNIGITSYTEEDEVYCRKVPKYKEVKHYIKGEVLGRGKFGVVREFVDKNTLKRYAGKILTKRQIQRNHLRTQVSKELSVMFHLNHPNILKAYDLFQNEKKLYMFLELCWGELAEFMQHYKILPKCQAKSYFIQMLEGLEYIHSRGIIHRDIKPENLLLNNSHVIKLADFGCIQEIEFFAETDTVSGNDGTPLYHPPELFEDKVMEYSGSKIDIWASGGILYHMLTGAPAFVEGPGDMADVVIKRIKTATPNYDVPIIKNDVLLLNLFHRLFEKDFTLRATICEIKNHSWVKNRCASNTLAHFRPYPTANQRVDSYRSITVITRIHEKYNPSIENKLYVDFKTFELSKQVKPLIRGTRIETKKHTRKNCSKTFI